jgi:Zn-dependent protease with chaperone function
MGVLMRYTLRALLAVAMLLGVYVLALGIVGALLLGVYEIVVHGLTGAFLVKLFVVAVLVAVAVGRGLWAGLRRPGGDETGVLLAEPDQPRLWSQVRHLAEQVGTRPPDEIRLIHDVNAAVSEDSRWLGLVSGTRRMYVGAPLLTGLTALQMRSVLAHELGHYGGRHTGLAGVTYRGQESLRGMIGHLGPSSLIGRILRLYARAYVAVASSVNRRQELEADECSARLAGKGVAIRALQELPAIDVGWAWFLEDYATDAAGGGRRPRELFAGFHHFWTSPEQQQRLDPLRTDPPVEQRSVYDSHPSTPERVAFMARLDAPDVPDDSGPALDLLDDAPAALRRLEEWMFEGSALTEVPWEEFASTSLAARTHGNAATLISAMELGGQTKGDLGQALEAMRLGWTIDLVAPLMREDASEEQRRLAAGGLVGDLVADALIANGLASYRLSWSEGRPLVGHDGAVLDPWFLAQAAAQSPEKVPDLAEWCQEHSVPLTHRPTR